jgi:pathogenesis-related protein 1
MTSDGAAADQPIGLARAIAIGLLLAAGCTPSGDDPSFGESSDAASPQSDADQPTDAPSMKAGADVSDAGASLVDARGGQSDFSDASDVSDASHTGDAGHTGDADTADGADAAGVDPETGRLAGITAAHNAVRAAVHATPTLPPLVWSQTIADYAQQWATSLATNMCAQPQHRPAAELDAKDYGENLAVVAAGGALLSGAASTAEQAVNAWAAEAACWTFGTILGTEKCDTGCYTNLHSDGCGHYTQVVWRDSTQLGCGVASCKNGSLTEDIWICNYAPAGNLVGRAPY